MRRFTIHHLIALLLLAVRTARSVGQELAAEPRPSDDGFLDLDDEVDLFLFGEDDDVQSFLSLEDGGAGPEPTLSPTVGVPTQSKDQTQRELKPSRISGGLGGGGGSSTNNGGSPTLGGTGGSSPVLSPSRNSRTSPTSCNRNNICSGRETCNNCPRDCDRHKTICGDGKCVEGENCKTCPEDCNGNDGVNSTAGGSKIGEFCCGWDDGILPDGCGDSRCTDGDKRCITYLCEGLGRRQNEKTSGVWRLWSSSRSLFVVALQCVVAVAAVFVV